jgi:hypothetical protein
MSACPVENSPQRPLIALVCRTPLVAEALTATLSALVDAIHADAVVADSDEDASVLSGNVARILLHVCPFQSDVRVLREEGWSTAVPEASAEAIRNLLAAELTARRRWS